MTTVQKIGVRQLRADLATFVRRAQAGERIVVASGGRAVAQLSPLGEVHDADHGQARWEQLVAACALIAPRRSDRDWPTGAVATYATVRFDRLLAEIRG